MTFLESLAITAAQERMNPHSLNSLFKVFSHVFLQQRFISSVKKLFRRPNPCSTHKKQSNKELTMKVMNDSKPSDTVTMVTLSQARNVHNATDELDGETSAQVNQISVS